MLPILMSTLLVSSTPQDPAAALRALERESGGRLGVLVLDTGSGRRIAHRATERFRMCSTFKALLAGAVLAQVDKGTLRLDDRLPLTGKDLIAWSPVCETKVNAGTMTVGELCAATISVSDNAAANLLLRRLGGPGALTAWLRSTGDGLTRLDRWEPELNEGPARDPRDTTTPEAMVTTLKGLLLGEVLTPASRTQLAAWMADCRTGDARLRAGLPKTWKVMCKTGTGEGIANHVAMAVPPGRPPVFIAAYLFKAKVNAERQNRILAEVARVAAKALEADAPGASR